MLTEAMKKQFGNAFGMLSAAIPSFSSNQWRSRAACDKAPGRLVLHTLACGEFYTSGDRSVHCKFGKGWWEMPDAELPTQEQMLAYLGEVRSKTAAWIDGIGDEGLAGPTNVEWATNNLDHITYALRHLVHHLGELCAYQKAYGLPAARWQ